MQTRSVLLMKEIGRITKDLKTGGTDRKTQGIPVSKTINPSNINANFGAINTDVTIEYLAPQPVLNS